MVGFIQFSPLRSHCTQNPAWNMCKGRYQGLIEWQLVARILTEVKYLSSKATVTVLGWFLHRNFSLPPSVILTASLWSRFHGESSNRWRRKAQSFCWDIYFQQNAQVDHHSTLLTTRYNNLLLKLSEGERGSRGSLELRNKMELKARAASTEAVTHSYWQGILTVGHCPDTTQKTGTLRGELSNMCLLEHRG